jgi:hypothetical protein
MSDPMMWSAIAGTGLAAIVTVAIAGLKGWRDWIGLQRLSLEGRRHDNEPAGVTSGASSARIELADLRERVRKLEAIAAGVDL